MTALQSVGSLRYFSPVQPKPRLQDPGLEASLERDGYAVLDDFLGAVEISQLADAFNTFDSPIHKTPFGASILSDDLEYRRNVDREIKRVVQPKVDNVFNGYRLCFANFVVKQPQPANVNSGEVMFHQDIAFVDESRFQSLAIWCPLVETSVLNGCLFAVPGSHRFNTGPRGPGTVHPYRDQEARLQKHARPIPMRAGSAMIYCQKLFHASPPNRGPVARVAAGSLLVPREAQLFCYYPDPASPGRMEVFAVDDSFYTQYIYLSRPAGVPRVGTIDYRYDPIQNQLDPA